MILRKQQFELRKTLINFLQRILDEDLLDFDPITDNGEEYICIKLSEIVGYTPYLTYPQETMLFQTYRYVGDRIFQDNPFWVSETHKSQELRDDVDNSWFDYEDEDWFKVKPLKYQLIQAIIKEIQVEMSAITNKNKQEVIDLAVREADRKYNLGLLISTNHPYYEQLMSNPSTVIGERDTVYSIASFYADNSNDDGTWEKAILDKLAETYESFF
jgi:hypothetical protein